VVVVEGEGRSDVEDVDVEVVVCKGVSAGLVAEILHKGTDLNNIHFVVAVAVVRRQASKPTTPDR